MLYKKLLGATLVPVAALVVATLSSCGGGSSSPATVIIPARFAYVANNTAIGIVSAFTIDKTSGAMSAVGTASTMANPTSVAVDPGGKYAYVTTFGGTISAYTIDQATGALTSPSASSVTATNPYAIKIHPNGKYAYVADGSSNNVVPYTFNQTGGLVAGTPVATGGLVASSLTIDPLSRFVYVVDNNSMKVYVSVLVSNSGSVSLGAFQQAAYVGGAPKELAIDPLGKFAYVVNGAPTVLPFSIDAVSGVLAPISGTGVTAGNSPNSVAVSPDGKFVYVVDSSGIPGTVYVFSIGSTGALTLANITTNPVPAGNGASRISIDPSGSFAYVTNKGNSSSVSMYSIDRSTGALTAVPASSGGPTVPAGTAPESITTTR